MGYPSTVPKGRLAQSTFLPRAAVPDGPRPSLYYRPTTAAGKRPPFHRTEAGVVLLCQPPLTGATRIWLLPDAKLRGVSY
jgi:hypothetical protein